VWWTWSERQLVLFLVLFLFYSAYFMLRFSVEPGPRRARMSAVYALFGVVLIPVSFLAIRLAEGLIHPVVFDRDVGENLAGSQLLTFVICLAGTLALAGSLYLNELTGKRLDARLAELREALS
jgi:heme exporter protein C